MCLIFTDFLRPVFYRTLMHDISNMIRHLYHCLSRLHSERASDLCISSARENSHVGDGKTFVSELKLREHDRAITWVFCCDLPWTSLCPGLLQKKIYV